MLALTHAMLVLPDHYIPDATLLVDNGKIVDFGRKLAVPEGAKVYDVNGSYVGPGLVDIHTHSDGQLWFYEHPEACSETLLKHGVTSVMPALYYNVGTQGYLDRIAAIDKAVAAGKFPNFLGYYMEGPYLNPKYGCDRENNPWKGPVDEKDFRPIVDMAGKNAKVWCVAPERDGLLPFVKYAKKVNPDCVFSVAHSEATPQQIEALIPYGLRNGTHHTNATGTLYPFPECRGVCVDECVNYHSDIYAELICDFIGIHVNPYLQRLLLKIKGKERLILISDAFVCDGPPIPGCEEAFDICFDHAGEIAGSKMTLDISCSNMMIHTGSSVCDVFRFASTNPADMLGLRNIGRIAVGADADLCIVDDRFHIQKTILKGELL